MPRFTLLRQGRVERSVALAGNDVLIGRLGSAMELPQPASRQHARVRREGERWFLEDLGGACGLWVGDRQVKRHELEPGDTFRIEEYAVLFEPSDAVWESGVSAARDLTVPGRNRSMTFLNVEDSRALQGEA